MSDKKLKFLTGLAGSGGDEAAIVGDRVVTSGGTEEGGENAA